MNNPFQFIKVSDEIDCTIGENALKNSKLGIVLLAGGTGSRLGWNGPKGTYPITTEKTLFQLFSDKIDAASKKYNTRVRVAVMTSPENHYETVQALDKDKDEDWSFCPQKVLPYLDKNKIDIIPNKMGPDGNGGVFDVLNDGILKNWKDNGINMIFVLPVDNPLADPFDEKLISMHLANRNDLTVKVIERLYPEEKIGVFVQTEDGLRIIEYSECEKDIEYPYGNPGLYLFSLNLAIEAAERVKELPTHLQFKKIENDLWGYKQEKFIFDNFQFAKKIGGIIYPRELIFAPLKSSEDINHVRKELSKFVY
jgi:UDP-N-acetylglucosamine/UDP-N-acetylgalactosamine diphosphorylase